MIDQRGEDGVGFSERGRVDACKEPYAGKGGEAPGCRTGGGLGNLVRSNEGCRPLTWS